MLSRIDLFFLVAMGLLLPLIVARTIQVPILKSEEKTQFKIGQRYESNYPKYDLNEVRSRYVSEVKQNSTSSFFSCFSTPAEIQFNILDSITFDGVPKRPLLIYNFEDIQYERFLLDFYFENNEVYVMFQDGTVAYMKLMSDENIDSAKTFKVFGLKNNEKLQTGYFTKVEGKILFVNSKYVIRVTENNAIMVKGYKWVPKFESVTSIDGKFFATVSYSGLNIYRFLEGDETTVQIVYGSSKPKKQHLYMDVIYYAKQKAILLLDNDQGLLRVDLSFDGRDIVAVGDPQIIKAVQSCSIMNLNKITETLHILCDNMYDLDLQTWPNLKETSIKIVPGIKVQEIFSFGPLSIFIGRDAFEVVYWDQPVSYYEDNNMDRLIFTEDLFISANEEKMYIGQYKINDPFIVCQPQKSQLVGDHILRFQTLAECNQGYFQKYNVNQSVLGDYSQSDRCMYTTQQKVHIWKPGKILSTPVIILIIFLCIVFFAALYLMLWQKHRLASTRALYNYISQGPNKQQIQSGKDIKLNQQIDDVGQDVQGSQAKLQKEEDIEPEPKAKADVQKNEDKKQEENKKQDENNKQDGESYEIE